MCVSVSVRSLGIHLSLMLPMMTRDLICSIYPEKILEGNDSSDALWNGTIT